MTPEKAVKFLGIARAISDLSKDRRTKVGAVAVGPAGEIRAMGYNGFPRGCDDDIARYEDRDTKLALIVHAEQNLVALAAYAGTSLAGCTVVVSGMYPCSSCAKSLIQAGIKQVITPPPRENSFWTDDAQWSKILFDEASVEVMYVEEPD